MFLHLKKGVNTSFGNVKPFCKFGLSFWESEDNSDLYENGRSKRKRSYGGDEDDDDDDSKANDPNAYDSKMANYRTKLIKAELNKRKLNSSNEDLNKSLGQATEEDIQLAENTDLLDPLNKKFQNLSVKSRESWYKKILQLAEENYSLVGNKYKTDDLNEKSICAQIENEIFQKAKNLMIYQANCVKKINEIKKCTTEKISFLDSYLKDKQKNDEIKNEKIDNEILNDKKNEQSNDFKNLNFSTGFTSAKDLMLKCKEEKIETKSEIIKQEKIQKDLNDIPVKRFDVDKIKIEKGDDKKQDVKSKLDLQSISNLVVLELSPLYKGRKFENKDVFKLVARRITHYLNDKHINNETRGINFYFYF